MIDHMRTLDAKVPVAAKIDPIRNELSALVKDRWGDMIPQARKGIQSALASLEAALDAQRADDKRRCIADAAKGQLAPRYGLRAVE
jgi:hypothetical protein